MKQPARRQLTDAQKHEITAALIAKWDKERPALIAKLDKKEVSSSAVRKREAGQCGQVARQDAGVRTAGADGAAPPDAPAENQESRPSVAAPTAVGKSAKPKKRTCKRCGRPFTPTARSKSKKVCGRCRWAMASKLGSSVRTVSGGLPERGRTRF